jgi:hypothetical protein
MCNKLVLNAEDMFRFINQDVWHCAFLNPLNAELSPICHLLALLGAHHILHVRRIRVNISAVGAQ